MNNELGQRITKLRNIKNMTQDQLAEKVGVSRQAISKWERGEGLPDLYNLRELAKALDVSIDQLKDGTERNANQETPKDSKNYLKRLLKKAQTTTNSNEAKRIKKMLMFIGGIGFIIGIIMVISGFIGFAQGGMNAVNSFTPFGETFNPLPYMILFIAGGTVAGISIYVFLGGLAITIVGVTTDFLDE